MSITGSHGAGRVRRSFGRDESVKNTEIPPGTTRRIFKFVTGYKKLLAGFLGLLILDAGLGVVNPLIYREIINQGILNHRIDLIIKLALLVAGLAIGDAILSTGENYISAKIGAGLIFQMRTKIFNQIQKMPLAFFTRVQTGALVSRLNNDVMGAQEAFTDFLSVVVGNLLSVTMVLITMFLLSWRLTLVALVLVPLFLVPARWFGRRLQAITREAYDLNAQMSITMIERFNVAGALLAKLFGNQKNEEEQFAQKAGRVRDIDVAQRLYGRQFRVALMLTAALAVALVYGWGGIMAVRHTLDVGTLVALTAYLNRLYGPLTSLSNINVDIMTALVSFDRVFEVLDLKPMIEEKPEAQDIPTGGASIEFKKVGFRYPAATEVSLASLESVAALDQTISKDVLQDISFKAEPGQIIALVGPSGGGKTTITHLVSRLYDVCKGSVTINGVDVREAKLDSLHATIGVVTQDAHMFHDSIRNNLLYAKPEASEQEIIKALQAAQILPLIQSLPQGLDTIVGERGYRLSGGEKQRLAIARLILKAPKIVVLDEATAHLDSESEKAIQKALETVLKNRTSIVIAHRLSTIRKADQILVINKGQIIERGKHKELLDKNGFYAELYRTQFADEKISK